MLAKKSKRALAMVLTLVMLLGLLPASALSYTGETSGVGSMWVDPTQEDETTGSGYKEFGSAEVNREEDKVTVSKTAEQTAENEFEIKLIVSTEEDIKNLEISPDAAVVLVVDTSNSMEGARIQSVKDVLVNNKEAFLKTYADVEAGTNRKVALVTFGTDASSTYFKEANGRWAEATDAKQFEEVKNTISGLGTSGGTNLEGGLALARNLLTDPTLSAPIKGIGNRYVILLTDGEPTACPKKTPSGDATSISGKDGSEVDIEDVDNVPGYAAEIKSAGAKLLAVGYGNVSSAKISYPKVNSCEVAGWHQHDGGYNEDEGTRGAINKETGRFTEHSGLGGLGCDNTEWHGLKSNHYCTYGWFNGPHTSKFETATIESWMKNIVKVNNFYKPTDAGQLAEDFKNITESIITLAQAWIATDPMSKYVTFSEVTSSQGGDVASFDKDENTLSWNLFDDTPVVKGGVHTYTLTYKVTLNNAMEGFETGKPYPANGQTSLAYVVLKDGEGVGDIGSEDLKRVDFHVPTVWGTVPTVQYNVEYYKYNRTTKAYEIEDTATGLNAKLWTTVDAPEGYEGKYNNEADGWYQLGGDSTHVSTTSMKITANNQTMKLYYDPTPVSVTVNHILTTVEKTDEGDKLVESSLGTDTPTGCAKGDRFSATLKGYDIDSAKQKDQYENVLLEKSNTEITIYYITNGEDKRTEVNYTVNYFYKESVWAVGADGKLAMTWPGYPDTPAADTSYTGKGRNGDTVFAIMDEGKTKGYTLDVAATGSDAPSKTLGLVSSKNVLNVYLRKETPKPASNATLQINYIYESIVPGGAHVEDARITGDVQQVYVGEVYTADDKPINGDCTYNTRTTNQPKNSMDISITEGANVLNVTYVRDSRVMTGVTVNYHFFQQYWDVDNQGKAVIVTTGDDTYFEYKSLENIGYAGESYTAADYSPLEGVYEGFGPRQSNVYTIEKLDVDGEKNVIDLYYDRAPLDNPGAADTTVVHTYYTYRSYVNGEGKVIVDEMSSEYWAEETVHGTVGGWFMAYPALNGEDGSLVGFHQTSPVLNGTEPVKVTHTGQNGMFKFDYERHIDELTDAETAYTVQPILVTRELYVDQDGVTKVRETGRTDGTAWNSSEDPDLTVYAGQKITADPARFAPEGYAFSDTDSDTTPNYNAYILDADSANNVINLVYVQTTPTDGRGEQVDVIVRNHYTFETFRYVDGVLTPTADPDDETVTSDAVKMYVNEFFLTEGKGIGREGYALEDTAEHPAPAEKIQVTADGPHYVDFYWYGSLDKSDEQKAEVQVIHHYALIDEAGQWATNYWTVGDQPDDIITGKYATQKFLANYNFQNGSFTIDNVVEVDPAGAADPAQGVILAAGLNTIHIYYERYYNSRISTGVKIIHNYFGRDTFTTGAATDEEFITSTRPEYTVSQSVWGRENGAWVGNSYTAKAEKSYTVNAGTADAYTLTYEVLTANPVGATIDSLVEADDVATTTNVITINYIRHYTSREDAKVTVEHIYQTYDSFTGNTTTDSTKRSELLGDGANGIYVGASFTAAVEESGDYRCQTAEADRTVILGRDSIVRVYYLRTTNTDPSLRTAQLTVNYNLVAYDDAGNLVFVKALTAPVTESYPEGYEYNLLPAKEFPGYSYLALAEGSAPAAGTLVMGEDVAVTLNYVARRFEFRVDFINDYTNTTIETVWNANMTAEFGQALTDGFVAPFVGGDGWQASRMPSGYTLDRVVFPEIGVSGNGVYNAEDNTFDASAVTNIVEVHYGYTEPGPGPGPSPDPDPDPVPDPDPYDPPDEPTGPIGPIVIVPPDVTEPEIEIEDEETPLADKPETTETVETDEVEIVDDEVPLGNLPQTGTTAQAATPWWTLGLLALMASLSAAGLSITFSRKREEEEEG